MDPHTGRVFAMAGGYSFERGQFNRAIQAKRQPGSSFKPFVYAAAMEQVDPVTGGYKWTPTYRVPDIPYVSCDPNQERVLQTDQLFRAVLRPHDTACRRREVTERHDGASRVRDRIRQGVGHRQADGHLRRHLPPYESMALGPGDTTLMRMAMAYAELVNSGKQVRPVMFDRIQNRYGTNRLPD